MIRLERTAASRRLGQRVCVVAGDGADRFGVLEERIEWRVEHGVSPLDILVLTPTEKAAARLRRRLAVRFASPEDLRESVAGAPVYSMPAFCAWLLRGRAVEAGLDPRFQAMDGDEASAEALRAAEEALDGWLEEDPKRVHGLLAALDLGDPVRELAWVYQTMRLSAPEVRPGAAQKPATGSGAFAELVRSLRRIVSERPREWTQNQRRALAEIQAWGARILELANTPASPEHFSALTAFAADPHALRKGDPVTEAVRDLQRTLVPAARQGLIAEYYAPQRALLFDALERLERRYRERLEALNALDPAGLEEMAVRLLRDHEPLRASLRGRFVEVLVEGMEDLNALEAALIDLVRPRRGLFVVGDPNEAVDGLSFAGPEGFRRFREALRAQGRRVERLKKDYRSRSEILWAREAILAGAKGVEERRLEAGLRFPVKAEPSLEVIAAQGENLDAAAELEAQLVAQRICEIEGALRVQAGREDAGVRPVRLSDIAVVAADAGALGPFERALDRAGVPRLGAEEALETADLIRLLRVIRNPRDEISLAAILRSAQVDVSEETLYQLKQFGNLGVALGWLERIDESRLNAAELERLYAFRSRFEEWRTLAGDASGLSAALAAAGYGARALARVRESRGERPLTLNQLIGRLEHLRERAREAAPPEHGSNAVSLLTVRAAKGLAFPVVFIGGLGRGHEPEPPPLGYSPSTGLAVRWIDPVTGDPVKDSAYTAFCEEWRRGWTERESRSLWTALGVAGEHLALSFGVPPGGARHWAERIVAALGLDVSAATNRPAVHEAALADPERKLAVRLLCANQAAPVMRAAGGAAAAREELPRPALSGQHDAIVPAEAVALFDACPRWYFLERYLGWQRTARPSGPSRAEEDESAREPSRPGLAEKLGPATRLERDFDYVLEMEGVVVEGRIDLWFENEGRLAVVEVRTEDAGRDEAAQRAPDGALALRLHALALERFTGRAPGEALVYFSRPDAVTAVSLDGEQLGAARQALRDLVEAQSRMQFPPRSGEHCRGCPYHRGLCPGT